jgi:hypothetical protein
VASWQFLLPWLGTGRIEAWDRQAIRKAVEPLVGARRPGR